LAHIKSDLVFRRIFAKQPGILCGLLNELLDRRGELAIEVIAYLRSGRASAAAAAGFFV
jgi:hypothetical protein